MELTKEIQEIRATFQQELPGKQDSVHPKDLERWKSDDKWVRRFLLHHDNDQKEALKMVWDTMKWRKEFGANDINDVVKMDIVIKGGFFAHGYDKDGSILFVLKCKSHTKGSTPMEELKKVIVYWFERLERQEHQNPITLFFDMEGCGLANVDMELTRYLISLFKDYYPYFLNYILIFEMPWVLTAAFKIIKSWLPEKAVQKIKFISKKDIQQFVPLDQALVCWGGSDTYTFSFIPENANTETTSDVAPSNRKVHFADGSSMSESPGSSAADKDNNAGGNPLAVEPPTIISFVKEGGELVSTLELHNTDPSLILSYKLKTTSPEKFRVRPSVGSLTPGSRATIQVTLLPGFQLGGLSRDKFLVMSTPIEPAELSQDIAQLWKDTTGRKVSQHRLRCAQNADAAKNGGVPVQGGGGGEPDFADKTMAQLSANVSRMMEHQSQIHHAVKETQYYQMLTVILIVLLGVVLAYVAREGGASEGYCTARGPSSAPI